MTFVLLDDASWSHPKALRAGNEAWGAFTRMLAYCSTHLTDGIIDSEVALSIAMRPKVLDKLVAVGLLERVGDTFRVHDYLEHNPSRAQVEAKRKAKTERQNRWRKNADSTEEVRQNTGKSARVDASTAPSTRRSTDASRSASKDAAPSHPIPSHPIGGGPRAPARTPPRAHAREETPPPPQPIEQEETSEPLVSALADGAGDLWANDGEAWRRERLETELKARDFDEDGARLFGRFLQRNGIAASLNAARFSPYWFVFGSSPQRAEFKHLDAAVEAFDRWCDAEDARRAADADRARRQQELDAQKAAVPVRSNEAVSTAMRAAINGFKQLPVLITAHAVDADAPNERTSQPNTSDAEQRGAETIGQVLEDVLGAKP